MPTPRVVITLCLLGPIALELACKSSAPASSEAEPESPEAKRKRECEHFAADMARMGLVAGQVLVTALADDPHDASEGRTGMKAEAAKLRQQLLEQCMQWPDDVMACLPPLGVLKDGCEEKLVAAMSGAMPPPKHVPAGPALAWSFTLESDPQALAVTEAGTVVVIAGVESDGLVALKDGTVVWRKEGDFSRWLLPLPGAPSTWVVAERERLVAFDPETGVERWSATSPLLRDEPGEPDPDDPDDPDPDDGQDEHRPHLKVAARHGDAIVVGDAEARFLRVDPARCAAAAGDTAGSCTTVEGRLPDETLDGDARLFVDAGGTRYLQEHGVLRAFGDDWSPVMTVRAHDSLSQVSLAGDRLVLIIDDDVLELDPAKCHGSSPFAPSGWPQPGTLVIAGADECDECGPPPPGCRRWRAHQRDVAGQAPALLHDRAVVVNVEGHTLALDGGATRWKAVTGGGGPLVTDGTRVFGFSTELRDGDPPGLFEIGGADGGLRWRTPLSLQAGLVYYGDDIRLALGGPWLVAAFEQTIVALPVPPA